MFKIFYSQEAGWRYKSFCFILYAVFYSLFYVLPNFSPIREPKYLPLWGIDLWIPLLPETFLLYVSDYALVISVMFLHRDKRSFDSFCRLAFGSFILCGLLFLFFPTTYPRPPYPVVENSLIATIMSLVNSLDTPNNCFPSNHVAMTAAAVWSLRFRGPLFWSYGIWAVGIFASTLTTKQHYFVDILGGLVVVSAVAFCESLVTRRFSLFTNPAS